jgi:hypothetical protein
MMVAMVALLAWIGLANVAQAAALTSDRNISSMAGEYSVLNVESGTVIYAGSLVAVDTNQYAVSASDAATLKVIGVAVKGVDQRAPLYDSTKTITVRRGVFLFKNGGSLTDANIGDWAIVEDDQTVSTAAEMTNDLLAGVIVDVDSDGVWVDVGSVNRAGAISGATLSTTGNGAIGGTLAVTSTSSLGGNVTVGSSKVTIAASSGNTAIGGTLGVTGSATMSNVTASGAVLMTGLPTSTNGLSAGALWNDGNTIKIMP